MLRARLPVVLAFALAAPLAISGCDNSGGTAEATPASKEKAPAKDGTPDKEEPGAKAPAKAEPNVPEAWKGYEFAEGQVGLKGPPAIPADNPMSKEKVSLGHKLFMDKRLSFDGSRSCYSCHQNQLGNADGRPKALGAGDKPLSRNTPTIWNVAYHKALYWDGRAPSLEKQALGAWKGGNMGVGADNLDAKAAEIGDLPEYRKDFESIFAVKEGEKVKPDHVAMALSAYERTLVCGNTAWDKGTASDAAKRGFEVFSGKGQCAACHYGELYADGNYHQIGIGFDAEGKVVGAEDMGRAKPSKDETMKYKFRTPTLRNVSKTAPYFHDGSVASLEQAVKYMAGGGNPKAPGNDPLLQDRKLTDAEVKDVVAFLESLACTGELEVIGDQAVPGITDQKAG